jgi:hypothetical protein
VPPRSASPRVRAVVFDVGETLLDESTEYGTWADWLGVPRHTFSAMFGAVIARGDDYRQTFQHFRPGFDLAGERLRREEADFGEHFDESDLYPDARPSLASAFHEGWGWFAGWLAMGADGGRVAASGGVGSRGWVGERIVGALGDAAAGVRSDSRHAKVPAWPVRGGPGVGDGQQRSGSARSRVNARASAVAHGQVTCRRRMTRRAWRTIRAATCKSR